jgi:phospholipid/cholesterol/gamma-HCH transport system substrate-binding protein
VKRSREVRWAEVRVGVFLVMALVFLALGILAVGRKTRLFVPQTKVEVILSNVQGLKIGAPVWLSGVVVGAVSDIAFASPLKSDRIDVILEIETTAARRLGQDARITIKTRGLLGEKYVDILPGTEGGIPEQPITGIQPLTLDQVVNEAYTSFERLDRMVERMESGQGTMGRLVQDSALYDSLVGLSDKLQKVLSGMTEGQGSLAKMIKDPRLYQEMSAFSREGQAAAGDLRQFVRSLQEAQGTLGKLIHDPRLYDESLEMVQKSRQSLQELDSLLGRVRDGQGTAGKLVNDADLYDSLDRTLKDLSALVEDMKKNPKRYVHFSLF